MAEDRSSAGNGDSHESSIWTGLRNLIFGEPHEDTLRDQLEEAIDAAQDAGKVVSRILAKHH